MVARHTCRLGLGQRSASPTLGARVLVGEPQLSERQFALAEVRRSEVLLELSLHQVQVGRLQGGPGVFVAVVGFDNVAIARACYPELTTVDQNNQRLAEWSLATPEGPGGRHEPSRWPTADRRRAAIGRSGVDLDHP
ncbi:hypothetical protein GCM10023317_27140 [Actinopolymorpha pittospori]|uniref:Uncharacterized protein n=1 Tax=Actinopolymorpha pittospori TaxID=648752 RepID=A0A927MVL8_9ACTN|nr:hypothetical protein [Actinopolymorpha pittospori]